MLSVKIIGAGCANCERLGELAKNALQELKVEQPGLEGAVEKVTDPAKFMDYGVMMTPGLVVNDRLVSSGRIPSPGQIVGWLREALTEG